MYILWIVQDGQIEMLFLVGVVWLVVVGEVVGGCFGSEMVMIIG